MIKILEKILSIIYIRPCFYCNSIKENSLLCKHCHNKINFLPPSPLKSISGCEVYACAIYEDVIKKLITDLKYKQQKKLAQVQAELMYEYFKQLSFTKNFLLLSVPIHKNRRKERKYNHMELVLDEFSYLSGFPKNKKFLLRIKDTTKQFKLHKKERIKNIQNAFTINKNEVIEKNTPILLLDDITSTGITIEEIFKVLKKNGYNDLTALTLATPDIWNTIEKQKAII